MSLTDAACRAAKATDKGQTELADGRGLYLVVGKTGHKSWVLRYKDGKQSRRLTIGVFDPRHTEHVGVASARAKAAQVKADLKSGDFVKREPKTPESQPEPVKDTRMTVRQAFARYMRDHWGAGKLETADKRNRARFAWFENNFAGAIGDKAVADLTRVGLRTLLRERHAMMKESGATGRGIANVQAQLSAFLGWCADNEDLTGIDVNPILGMPKIDTPIERDRWLDGDECGWFVRAMREVGNGFAAPSELLLRAGCRLADVFDLTPAMVILEHEERGPHLLIPKTKNSLPIVIPLTRQMKALLPNLNGKGRDECIWPVSISTAKSKARVVARMNELAGRELENWRLHDLRTTVASHLDTLGIDDRVIEKIVGHKEQNAAKRTYRRYAFYPEKKAALERWNDLLDQFVSKVEKTGRGK